MSSFFKRSFTAKVSKHEKEVAPVISSSNAGFQPTAKTGRCNATKTSLSKSPQSIIGTHVCVLFVEPSNAKEAKNCLEALGFLNKTFRMSKIASEEANIETPDSSESNVIAIPVTEDCWNLYNEFRQSQSQNVSQSSTIFTKPWFSFVVVHGRRAMPLATGQFARGKKKNR